VLSLAPGIGANTAIFSLLDLVVLRSLPVADPERLVALHGSYSCPGETASSWGTNSEFGIFVGRASAGIYPAGSL
jgi:hypothetical protein